MLVMRTSVISIYSAYLFTNQSYLSWCRPEWIGEALVKGLEDDSVNGIAIQLLSREPVYHFGGPNSSVAFADKKQ
jgi:hypothetical protein